MDNEVSAVTEEKLMKKKSVLVGSIAVAASTTIGVGALALGGTSLASNNVPTTHLAASSTTKTPSPAKPHHRRFRFMRFGQGVYSETVVHAKGGGYKTIITVHGPLSAITPSSTSGSISVTRPDTGTAVMASINSSTKFVRTSEAALQTDATKKISVNIRLVEIDGVAKVVMVPPPPGTRPLLPHHPHVKGSTSSGNSGSASFSGSVGSAKATA
jgi:hypothetical protein